MTFFSPWPKFITFNTVGRYTLQRMGSNVFGRHPGPVEELHAEITFNRASTPYLAGDRAAAQGGVKPICNCVIPAAAPISSPAEINHASDVGSGRGVRMYSYIRKLSMDAVSVLPIPMIVL